jgi:hypothetical protein
MKLYLLPLLLLLLFCGCKKEDVSNKPLAGGNELVGSWIGKGTNYAGSRIIGSTIFVFNSDKTFVALDKAKGMPTLTEKGEWFVNGDTLKLKFKKAKKAKIDEIAYEERNGGPKDIIKPVPDDSSGVITWNYKISGNKLLLENNTIAYVGTSEFIKED